MKKFFISLMMLFAIHIVNAQNVGIGTTNPLSLLHVGSDATAYSITDVVRIANNNGEVLGVSGSSAFSNINFWLNGITARKATIQAVNGGTQGGQLAFFTKGDFPGEVIERLRINQNGNVGIGTTSPSTKLDIAGGGLNVSSNTARTANFVNTATFSNYGVYSSCISNPGNGRGVWAEGGLVGVHGQAIIAGTGSRWGLVGYAWYGAHYNFGVHGYAYGGVNTYGVYSEANGGSAVNWAGHFVGNVYTNGTYQGSDRKLKTDIKPLSDALSIINQFNPSVYTYKINEYKQMNLPEGLQYGLIADEVQHVVPGAVKKVVQPAKYENHDEHNGKKLSDEVQFKAVNYTSIIPILIGGMKEQQLIIDNQNKKIDQQQQQINELLKEIQLIKEKLR